MDKLDPTWIDFIGSFGALIIVAIDRITKREFYIKLLVIASLPNLIRRRIRRFRDRNFNPEGMLCSKDLTLRFFNGIDKYDDKVIRQYANAVHELIRKPFVDAIVIDFTKADTPTDMRKVEFLLKLINAGSLTKRIKIFKPAEWSLNLPRYPNYDIIDIVKANQSSTNPDIKVRKNRRT